MKHTQKYLGPSWKVTNYTYFAHNKHNQIMSELMNLDEKVYIPLDDVFFMLSHPNPYYTPKYFVQLISEDTPEAYNAYISDTRPSDEFNPVDYIW